MEQQNLFPAIIEAVRNGLHPDSAILAHEYAGKVGESEGGLLKRTEIALEEELVMRVLTASREPGFRGTAAAQWLLERRFRQRWGRIAGNPTATVDDVKAMTDEQLEMLSGDK